MIGEEIEFTLRNSLVAATVVFRQEKVIVFKCLIHLLPAEPKQGFKRPKVSSSAHSLRVRSDDRPYLYGIIRRAVFAHTSQELAEALTAMHHDVVAVTYDKFICYCNKLVEKSELWAACYRGDAALRGHSTNNTVESSIRILKDKIFKRLKAFNLVQLTDFLVTRLEQYPSQTFVHQHSEEQEVVEILAADSDRRKALLTLIRNRGAEQHNMQVSNDGYVVGYSRHQHNHAAVLGVIIAKPIVHAIQVSAGIGHC